jgi:hypothetical protein
MDTIKKGLEEKGDLFDGLLNTANQKHNSAILRRIFA